MKRRPLMLGGAAAALTGAAPPFGRARGAGVKRVGWLNAFAPDNPTSVMIDQFYDAELQRLGWERGRNLESVRKYGPRDAKGREAAARELVDARVDVIVTFHDSLLGAAARATATIPIVALSGAIVEYGFAQSLARPGGNVTGVVSQSHEASGRIFSLLGIRPGLQRIGVPAALADRGFKVWFDTVEAEAAPAGVRVVALPLPRAAADIAPMLDAAAREQVHARFFLVGAGVQRINAWAIERRVLVSAAWARSQVLLSYGWQADEARVAFKHIDRVLRGTPPAEIPIEQPKRFDPVVNLKIVRAMGLAVPQEVLVQATEVVE